MSDILTLVAPHAAECQGISKTSCTMAVPRTLCGGVPRHYNSKTLCTKVVPNLRPAGDILKAVQVLTRLDTCDVNNKAKAGTTSICKIRPPRLANTALVTINPITTARKRSSRRVASFTPPKKRNRGQHREQLHAACRLILWLKQPRPPTKAASLDGNRNCDYSWSNQRLPKLVALLVHLENDGIRSG